MALAIATCLPACSTSEPVEAAPPSPRAQASTATGTAPAPPETRAPVAAVEAPEVRAARRAWDRRLAASRDAPEDRVPTLVAALEEADPEVHAAALREIEREPRAVAAMLLLPIVEGRAGAADRPGAARILARHFRAFDFPGDERDATDRRLFAAIAAGLIGDADARSRWMDVLAAMFHVGTEADVRHEAAGRAGDIARSLGATLDPATARELRRVLEAAAPRDPRARTLAAWF
jgi:hypothetical protein